MARRRGIGIATLVAVVALLAAVPGQRVAGAAPAAGDLDGRLLGRLVGVQAWAKALSYFAGLDG